MKRMLLFSLLLTSAAISYSAEPIHLIKDDSYIIELESNPTTGYKWELTSLSKENRVQVEELPYQLSNQLIGSPGIQSWKVTAKFNGKARAVFNYKQPWETQSIETKVFDFIID